ncbi:MAG TPA: prephenate dehydrogenase/arogenate dehydrogenase family protein, partial [Caulobacterales bacterium]|nr:prephenate dehydrogenase/arogenate dehydrogenase family protein [Caulobacterales bacterium]
MTDAPFSKIAIIGAGHIGSSIARAVAAKQPDAAITLYDASADIRARAEAAKLGVIASSAQEAVKDADLVVLAVPVGAMGAAAA